jgi:hypothetical protein
MSDELNPTASVETPPTTEPEPEGVVEVQGQKLAPVSAIVAERERVRNTERERAAKERETLQQQLSQTQQQTQQLHAELEALKAAHAPKPPDIPDVSDEEAESFARHYELYTPQGLDTTRAKRLIKDRRDETRRVAQEAAQHAVRGPQEEIFRQASKQNFIWAANQRDASGNPLVDPKALAEQWAQLPAELTAKPEVAQHLLKTVAGEMLMQGKRPPTAPQTEPMFTEAAGGRRAAPYVPSAIEKRLERLGDERESVHRHREDVSARRDELSGVTHA